MSAAPSQRAVRDALCLALARPVSPVADWPLVFEVSRAERLLGIAWRRSGAFIRDTAPPALVTVWRAAALAQDGRARSQLAKLTTLTAMLEARGVELTVLKGPPLSVRLYNELGARQSVDVDVFVPPDARGIVAETLESAGWIKWFGTAPWDESFYHGHRERVQYLEVHSHLPGEALSHCGPLVLDGEPFTCETGTLTVAGGRTLPVYLAGNMAKHTVLPLSALVDFHTLWASQPAPDRAAAMDLARASRLARCLRWAVAQTDVIAAAATGDPGALEALGVRGSGRLSSHAYLRLLRLADHPFDVARIAGAWVWPRPARTSWRGLSTVWKRRLRKPLKAVGSFGVSYVRR